MKNTLPLLMAGCLFATLPTKAAESAKPNVVYLMADDLGWSDISVHPGGSIPTPNIDRLFEQGVELSNFMGWCVCSPTRAMLMTGRHPFRVGTGPETGGELAKEETTIAEGFKANGYATGIFGKWHNGEDPDTPEYRVTFKEAYKDASNKKFKFGLGVNEHGFDEAWVYYGGGADYFTRRTVKGKGPVSWWHNLEYRAHDAGYTDDFVTQRAIEFIRTNVDRPFFCYVPFHIVHEPLQAKDSDLESVDAMVTDTTKRTYSAMVQAMDRNVASILAELDQLGLRENTLVVFSSDNGATPNGSNLPLRGGKHTIFEGGTRLPTVIRWPKGGLMGGRVWDGLCGALDMFPTLMAMADLKMPETRPLDGKNVWPAQRDNTASPVESYYWVWRNEDALRTADWRLHRFFDRNELYDIRTDPGETTNVANANSEVVKSLTAKMDAWAESLGAALTHRPVPMILDSKPAPEGEVLEMTVTVTAQAKPNDRLIVPIATVDREQFATDYIEYDIAIAPDSLQRGFFYSPCKGNAGKPMTLEFKRGEGIDQFGREHVTAPEVQGGPGVWEHRIIGLCSGAPGALPRQGLVFKGGKPGTYKVYLDNLRLRHADGSITPIWTNGGDTRFRKIEDSNLFTDIRVRTVSATAVTSRPATQPVNLLFIITDQQRWDAMSCAGNPVLKTPHLDQLAREGVRFTSFYSACPVCVPARSVIFTGHSIESNHVLSNADEKRADAAPFESFDQILLRNGYRGEYHGKFHSPYRLALGYTQPVRWLNGKKAPPDCKAEISESEAYRQFVEQHVPSGPLQPGQLATKEGHYTPIPLDENYGKTPEGKSSQAGMYGRLEIPNEFSRTAFTAKDGLAALERLKGGPFTLTISIGPPHPPMVVSEPYYSLYPPASIPVPISINDPRTNSPYGSKKQDNAAYRNPVNIQQMTSIYYGMVTEIDDWIGKILHRLDQLGLADNTLVIFTSDHGEMLGDHGMYSKMVFYEGSVHVPLLMRLPGVIPAGTIIQPPTSQLDLFATILDYCGQPGHISEGQSLRPLIEGIDRGQGRVAISEWNSKTVPGYMVFNGRWKLMFGRTADARSLDALYDLQMDPDEVNNLIGHNPDRERYRAEAERMKSLLIEWLTQVKSPQLEIVKARSVLD